MKFALVILPDYRVYGPYETEGAAEEAARTYFGVGFDHAEQSNDFFIAPLVAPGSERFEQ